MSALLSALRLPPSSPPLFAYINNLFRRPPSRGRAPLAELSAGGRPARIRASYDAARQSDETRRHWSNADALDADAANSVAVRQKLRDRSRYESSNNGYSKGIERTHADYVVGLGPKLRMQTGSAGFNAMVEAAWKRWAKAALLRRKLHCACMAKVRDGEGILQALTNPNIADAVKLDLAPIETDRLATPFLPFAERGYVDGVRFDEHGNVLWYDILPYHPGGQWVSALTAPERVQAKYLAHWFDLDRPGQHRGIPEASASLNCGANARRWREATLAAAETAADFAGVLKTQASANEDPDTVAPFSTIELEKRLLTALPIGADFTQIKGEHPNATYETFHRHNLAEQARPLAMAYNIAACDATGMNFSSGRLNHQPYYMRVDVEREDCVDLTLDVIFALWLAEAVLVYGWSVPAAPAPTHTWDWPAHPQIDEYKTATARQVDLSDGRTTLSAVYSEEGLDFEDELPVMAADYGVTIDEMREILRKAVFKVADPTAAALNQLADRAQSDD